MQTAPRSRSAMRVVTALQDVCGAGAGTRTIRASSQPSVACHLKPPNRTSFQPLGSPVRLYSSSARDRSTRNGFQLALAGVALAALSVGLYSSGSISQIAADSGYKYDAAHSKPDLPHSYGSAADFLKAIAEIKGHFSRTLSGDADESVEDYVDESEDERYRHGFDEIGHDPEAKLPNAVVYPRDREDVVKVVQVANRYNVPLVPFSGGTSLEAHFTAPFGGISVDMSRMDQIIAFHPEDGDMVVQAGVKWDVINEYLAREGHKLFFPLDPGPGATIGGMVSTGASGTNAVRYGTARHGLFLNLEVVLPSGEVIKTRSRARKSSVGPDLTNLFIGAEGTLGIVVSATIRLAPLLPTSVGFSSFPTVTDACSAVRDIVLSGAPVQCCEFMDSDMVRASNEAGAAKRKYEERHSIFLKLSGSEVAMRDASLEINKIVKRHGAKGLDFAQGEEEMEDLWTARKNALWSAKGMSKIERVWTTDVCVPIGNLPTLITKTKEDMDASGLRTAIVAHAADGNFHAFLAISDTEGKDLGVAEAVVKRMARRAQDLDGTATGEHGIGAGKKQHVTRELGEGTVRVLKSIKLLLDPKNLFNPGKLYPESEDAAR